MSKIIRRVGRLITRIAELLDSSRNPIEIGKETQIPSDSIVMLVPDDRIDRRVLLEARSLVRAGWTVTVIAAPPPFKGYRLEEDSFPEVNIVRINSDRAAVLPNNLYEKIAGWLKRDWKSFYWYHNHFYLEALKHPAKVYVAHDLPVLPAALLAACNYDSYLVYDAHELYPEQNHFGQERTKLYSEVESLLAPLADIVITVNNSIAEEMVRRYSITKPEVILNCPEVNIANIAVHGSNLLRAKLEISEDVAILLYQGSLSLNRNLENLVCAMQFIARKDFALVIMGPGDDKRKELMNLASQHQLLNKNVFFHPAVSQLELLQFTASADAGIIPYPHIDLNSYYCSPNKLFEFIAAGIPILANDSPELRRFVADQKIGINMPMTGPADIAEAIEAFFSQDRAVFRSNLRKVSSKFIWEVEGEKIVNIYSGLPKSNPKHRNLVVKCAE